MTHTSGTLRIKIQQFGSGIAYLLHRFTLGFVPLTAAELMQRRSFGRRPAVSPDKIQLRNRHI